jgi:predicted RNase H-like nuclease
VAGLKKEIDKIDLNLPEEHAPGTVSGLKRFEDAIDALVCAWVGAQYLKGNALPYGDIAGAIWIPK